MCVCCGVWWWSWGVYGVVCAYARSTLLGVLTHGELDNGRGKSRQRLFRHAHEAESGRTSSVSHDILGFSINGDIVNKPCHDGKLDWTQICHDAAKVLTFIDLAGHERYLKTTVFGLTVRTMMRVCQCAACTVLSAGCSEHMVVPSRGACTMNTIDCVSMCPGHVAYRTCTCTCFYFAGPTSMLMRLRHVTV